MRWMLALVLGGCSRGDECPSPRFTTTDGRCGGSDLYPSITQETEDTDVPSGNDVDLASYPPVVISSTPASGDLGLPASTVDLDVRFSKPMQGGSWAWVQANYPFPETGEAEYVLPTEHVLHDVVVEADSAYVLWMNDPFGYYASFADDHGQPLLPYPYVIGSGAIDPALAATLPPAVVATDPVAGTDGVDPGTTRITVTFGEDMDPAGEAWIADAPRTTLPITTTGWDDARTAWADVTLTPGTTYAVWINAEDDASFADTDGNAALPYLLTFRTAD